MMGSLVRVLAICLVVFLHFSCSRKFVPAASDQVIETHTDIAYDTTLLEVTFGTKMHEVYIDSSHVDPVFVVDSDDVETDLEILNPCDSIYVDSLDVSLLKELKILKLDSQAPMLPQIDTIVIIGTGDIMPGTNFPDNRYLPPGGCAKLFNPVRDILQSGDVTFGNLEGVFSSNGGSAKKCNNPKTCYVFRMPDEYLSCILDAGYDVLSTANNHVNDFGYEGRINTYNLLEESGVPFAGFRSKPSTIFEKDGVIYGIAAFAPHSGTANLKD